MPTTSASEKAAATAMKTFDDLFQESNQAQRKFAARVTVFEGGGDGKFPVPRQYGRHAGGPRSSSVDEDGREGDRPPELSPKATARAYNEYEDILRDDWEPNFGPESPTRFSQQAQRFYDHGPKKFESGTEARESETFVNPVSTHVNPLSSSSSGGQWHDLIGSAKKASSTAKKVLTATEEEETKPAESPSEPEPPSSSFGSRGGWSNLKRQWQFTQQLQKNRNLAVNAALLSDYRVASIRLLSMELFRSLDKEEFGFITYDHVGNMKSAVWGWRANLAAQGGAADGLSALTAGEGGTSGVDDIR